jgi:hypothetical protein
LHSPADELERLKDYKIKTGKPKNPAKIRQLAKPFGERLSTAQVSLLTHLAPCTISRLYNAGKIKGICLSRKSGIWFDYSSVYEFMRSIANYEIEKIPYDELISKLNDS